MDYIGKKCKVPRLSQLKNKHDVFLKKLGYSNEKYDRIETSKEYHNHEAIISNDARSEFSNHDYYFLDVIYGNDVRCPDGHFHISELFPPKSLGLSKAL